MADPRDTGRNPLIIPHKPDEPRRRGCPVCGKAEYSGQMVYGVLTFKCRACGNEWQGGIGQEAQDPRVPMPPQDPRTAPIVQFELDSKKSDKPQEFFTRKPDPTQEFRKGAPIPPPGEEDA